MKPIKYCKFLRETQYSGVELFAANLSFDPAAPSDGSLGTMSALRHRIASQTISSDAVNGTVNLTGTATSRPRATATPPTPALLAPEVAFFDDEDAPSRDEET